MNAKRIFFALLAGMALLVVCGIAGIVIGNSTLQKQANKLVGLKLQSTVLDQQQTNLEQAKAEVTKYTALNTIAETIVPQDKDQALTVREISDFATAAGIKIGSITFPASSLGVSGAAKSAVSQAIPVAGISGVLQIPITVQSDTGSPTTFNQLVSFLQSLENNRHTAQVNQLSITPADTSAANLSFELVVNVYIKP